ncbi:RhoGAP-domain-containing protein [Backusella circina FSU 941]|nr:RhoGAP-domain-containing protein [Backusella circina FSU 941]
MTSEEIIAPNCQGCSKSIEEGAVVAFGEALFHVNCFVCAKCKERVNNQTNLLLLDDGRPVCDNCSYSCVLCHQVIRDEAIMTGDKAYHTECFKCSSCKNKIDDLIFTQTTKGIFCTKCYELRKEEKMRRRNNNNNKSDTKQLHLPTPTRSRNNSIDKDNNSTKNKQSSDFSVSLDFFNTDSSELANLSDSLGANLSLNFGLSAIDNVEDINPTQTRINRASEILQSSLRTSLLKNLAFDKDTIEKDVNGTDKLKQELEETRSRLKEVETNYNLLQDASQQALDEFTKVKDDFAKEAIIKQKQELIIAALLRKNGGILSKQNITKAAHLRVEIDRACIELVKYRDELTIMTDQQAEKQLRNTIHGSEALLKSQIKALKSERDVLRSETKELRSSRDEIIHEITLLNSKNAELTNMNNELSMRAIEKEEAVSTPNSVMVQPSSSTLSVSHSTDSSSSLSLVTTRSRKISDASSIICKVSTRNSFIADQTPKLFRIKKKGSTMFSKFSGSSNAGNSGTTVKSSVKPEPSISSKSSIYNGGSNSSLQNLAHSSSSYDLSNLSGSLGKSSKSKLALESSLSLHQIPTTHQGGSHSFQPTSFLRPIKCGACGDKIWGRSEYRCDGCGFSSHSRCLSKVPQQCLAATSSTLDLLSSASSLSPDSDDGASKQLASMFGMDISERVKIEKREVPLLVEECIKAVEVRGLEFEGIYRKSGGAAQIRSIQTSFDQREKIDLCDEDEYNDIGSITSALKQYFRELPNPLLTFEAYDAFIEVSTMANGPKKIDAFKNIIAKLPTAHRDTMSLLFKHLERIYQHCDTNRMSIKNLSLVFAPTLMRHSDASKDFLDMSYKNATVEFILTNTSQLF